MKFVLAITSFNRLEYLKVCLNSWKRTKGDHEWTVIIADDGSNDGTQNYIKTEFSDAILIQNDRSGVHNQVNSILKELTKLDFDLCFKIDDDIEFLKSGWDQLYYNKAKETGYWHLVYSEPNWAKEQELKEPVRDKGLIGNNNLLNVHGFFYTISKDMLEKVGYFDVENFGFRGMGHVDYTARACRAGFNQIEHPFDVEGSENYISAHKEAYEGAIPSKLIMAYDSYHRKRKEAIIQQNRIFIPLKDNQVNYDQFQQELPKAFEFALEEKQKEIEWYQNTYEVLPKWWKKIGAVLRRRK